MIYKIYNTFNNILNSSPLIEMLVNSLLSIPIGFISGIGLQYLVDKKAEKERHKQQINDTINIIKCGEYININSYSTKVYSNKIIQAISQYNDCQQNVFDELRYVFCGLLQFKQKEQYKNIDLYRWQYLGKEDLRLLNKVCKLYVREDFSAKSLYGCTEVYAHLCKFVHSSDGFEIMSFMHWIDTTKAKELKNILDIEKNKVIDLLKKVEH